MKVAILGTRGVPNNHGGFEQFAEHFSVYLVQKNHDVYVYNSHNHPFQEKVFKGVNIVHCYDPEYKLGALGQFIYDLNCILDARKRKYDIILQLGYTSSSIWHWLMPRESIIVTNMDGLEWMRTKYKPAVRKFLKYAEKLGANYSDYLISDSIGIQEHLFREYNKQSEYIAYGATNFISPSADVLTAYNIKQYEYSMILARLEPENNIETIIQGYVNSNSIFPLIIVGGLNEYGSRLQKRYESDLRIKFVGPNYNQVELNNLRYYSRYYFHGHSVGGTNPSLLEAMASSALIIANDNVFNRSILCEEAGYFNNHSDVLEILNKDELFTKKEDYSEINQMKIEQRYNWSIINSKYENYLTSLLNNK